MDGRLTREGPDGQILSDSKKITCYWRCTLYTPYRWFGIGFLSQNAHFFAKTRIAKNTKKTRFQKTELNRWYGVYNVQRRINKNFGVVRCTLHTIDYYSVFSERALFYKNANRKKQKKDTFSENRVKIHGMECTTYNVRGPPSAIAAVVVAENSGRVFCFFLATRLATFLFT